VSPFGVSGLLWFAWALSWGVAAVWSRRTKARVSLGARAPDLLPTVLGGGLMAYSAHLRAIADQLGASFGPVWRLPYAAEWLLTLAVATGLGFTWWARLTLGDLWSSTVTRKEGHVIVDRGPYGLVRHPIYTGLILAAFALGAQIGLPASLAGAALMALGFAIKARTEERFLSVELGPAYADYRARTPMLVPFWPVPGLKSR
jgi:protein-S-isoprenylcysteine O-methyltransferase Ste14